MNKRVKVPNYSSISNRLSAIREDNKTIQSSVILTFEFHEELAQTLIKSNLLNVENNVESDDWQLRGDWPAVLFYDPRREPNGLVLPNNFEIHFWKGKEYGCHHSKAYAFIYDDDSAELIISSANFTIQGMFKNRELICDFLLSKDDYQYLPLFKDWLEFLKDNTRERNSTALTQYIQQLNKIIQSCTAPKISYCPRLLISGYEQSDPKSCSGTNGLNSLKKYIQSQGVNDPVKMVIVSPFFDKNQSVINQFINKFPSLVDVYVFSNNWSNALSVESSRLKIHHFCIPDDVSVDEDELLKKFWGGIVDSFQIKKRPLHAKLLLLLDKNGNGVIYVGSANFTRNAWLGKNYELGVVGLFDRSLHSEKKIQSFIEGLFGVKTVKVPSCTTENFKEDPEDANIEFIFPKNLESIKLTGIFSDEGRLTGGRFVFHTIDNTKIDGNFLWNNAEIELSRLSNKQDFFSQILPLSYIEDSLSTSRVMTWKYETQEIAIPFNIDSNFGISAQVHFLVQDALSYLTDRILSNDNPQSYSRRSKAISQKIKEDNNFLSEKDSSVRRDQNTVIYVQNWLKNLAVLENALFDKRKKITTNQLQELPIFFKCISAQIFEQKEITNASACLCTGEIYKLAKKVYEKLKTEESGNQLINDGDWRKSLETLLKNFETATEGINGKTDQNVLQIYKNFVMGGSDE